MMLSTFQAATFLMVCLMLHTASAVRGENRRLQPGETTPGAKKDDKAAKCRPLPKDKRFLQDTTPSPTSPSKGTDKTAKTSLSPAPSTELPYCPEPGAKKDGKPKEADCSALATGELPASANSAEGRLSVDVNYNDSPQTVLAEVTVIFQKETSAAVAGCGKGKGAKKGKGGRRQQQQQQQQPRRRLEDSNSTDPTILGVNFTNIEIGDSCTPVNKSFSCSEVTSDVAILYEGDADASQEAAMFVLLKQAIETQAVQGAFDGVGAIGTVETERSTVVSEAAVSGATTAYGDMLPFVVYSMLALSWVGMMVMA